MSSASRPHIILTSRKCSRWLIALGCAAALGACPNYNAGQPAPLPVPILGPPEASVVQVPVAVALADIQTAANGALPVSDGVPRWNGQVDGGSGNCGKGFDYGYEIRRSPLAMAPAGGGGVAVNANIEYAGGVRARPHVLVCLPPISGSCGYDGDPMKHARASLSANPQISPTWTIDLRPGPASVVATDGFLCRVTFLNIDMTGKVMGFATKFVNDKLGAMSHAVAQDGRIRDYVESAWAAAVVPRQIGNAGWVELSPRALAVSPLDVKADSVRIVARLEAMPAFSVDKPTAPAPTPLPNNAPITTTDSLRIVIPATASYGAVAAELRKAFKLDEGGIRFPATGNVYVRPTSVDVMSNGPQLVVRVGFKMNWRTKGVIYLAGTPTYDATTRKVTAPDLDYTAESKNVLLKLADWLGHDALRDALRARATVDVGPAADKAKAVASELLNKQFDRLALTGQVDRLELARIQVVPNDNAVRVDARLIGHASAKVLPLGLSQNPVPPQ
ncbi:MAG TPA: DUF4403 family protein [Gemmatimonadaceae bacterium]